MCNLRGACSVAHGVVRFSGGRSYRSWRNRVGASKRDPPRAIAATTCARRRERSGSLSASYVGTPRPRYTVEAVRRACDVLVRWVTAQPGPAIIVFVRPRRPASIYATPLTAWRSERKSRRNGCCLGSSRGGLRVKVYPPACERRSARVPRGLTRTRKKGRVPWHRSRAVLQCDHQGRIPPIAVEGLFPRATVIMPYSLCPAADGREGRPAGRACMHYGTTRKAARVRYDARSTVFVVFAF